VAFAGWIAQQGSKRRFRSHPDRAALARRRADVRSIGRQPGSTDKKPRKRTGYVASWTGGRRRAALSAAKHSTATSPVMTSL
jgi:hypothetical protein